MTGGANPCFMPVTQIPGQPQNSVYIDLVMSSCKPLLTCGALHLILINQKVTMKIGPSSLFLFIILNQKDIKKPMKTFLGALFKVY